MVMRRGDDSEFKDKLSKKNKELSEYLDEIRVNMGCHCPYLVFVHRVYLFDKSIIIIILTCNHHDGNLVVTKHYLYL